MIEEHCHGSFFEAEKTVHEIRMIAPMGYLEFLYLNMNAGMALKDSGNCRNCLDVSASITSATWLHADRTQLVQAQVHKKAAPFGAAPILS